MTDSTSLEVIGKKYAAEILVATAEPKTAQELSENLDIPIATCYRRIKQLQEHDLLEGTVVSPSDPFHQCQQYQRKVDKVTHTFDDTLHSRYEQRPDTQST